MFNIGDVIDFSEITKDVIQNDNTMYDILEEETDYCWDDLTNKRDRDEIKEIIERACNRESQSNDTERMLEILNKDAAGNGKPFHIAKILKIYGPGGGWPVVKLIYNKITLKEFNELYDGQLDGYDGEIKILKIYN